MRFTRRFRVAKPKLESASGVMHHVFCPECGDVVAGDVRPHIKIVKCHNPDCKKTFPLDQAQIRVSPVWQNPRTRRWELQQIR